MKKIILLFIEILCFAEAYAQNPPITPAWAFGHFVWEDSLNNSYSTYKITNDYLAKNIPVDAVIIDSPWSNTYNDFDWDSTRYEKPLSMIQSLNNKKIKIILWLTGNINEQCKDTKLQKSPMYDYVRSHHFGVNNSEPYNWWKGRGIHLDFTNEEAKNWWYSQLDKVFTNGVYGWKVDQGEDWLGDFVETSKGKMSKEQFKPYYYDAMYDYTVSRKPEGIIIARPYSHQGGYASSVDKMNMGWCGDFSGDWQGLHNQIHDIYMSALRGYGAIGCEVGGFYMKKSDRQQFARYAQFGCMTACMINGGENGAFSNHLPWYHGKDIECIYRFCVSLHQELRPYMFSSIVDSHLHGGSLIRNVSFQEESHLVGSDIFTKPITTSNDSTSFHLPPFGHWINFWNGKKYNAGTKMHEKYQLSKFPLFIKSGAIIPLQINDNTTELGDSTMKNRNVFMIWPNGLSQRIFHLPVSEGIEYENVFISYDEHQGHFTLHSKNSRKYTIVFRNIHNIRSVKGATYWKYNKSSNCLRIDINTNNAEIAIL